MAKCKQLTPLTFKGLIITVAVVIASVADVVSASEFLAVHPAPEEDDAAPPAKKRNKVSFCSKSSSMCL